jgi:AcrR family transcriptional regulator
MGNMSSVTRTGGRPRSARGQGATLRVDLLDATLRMLARTGDPDDVSIRAVAKAAGVSPTAVYQHFEDRDALLLAACDRAFELFATLLLSATEGTDDPFERLARSGQAYLAYALEEPGLYRVLFSNPLHLEFHSKDATFPHDDSAGANAFVVLVDMVQACLDAGAPATDRGDDAVYLSFQVWTWLHGIVDLHITHPGMDWPSAERMVADIAITLGLAAPSGA